MAPKIVATKYNRLSIKCIGLKNNVNNAVPLIRVLMLATNKEPSNLLYLLKANMAALIKMVTIKAAMAKAIYLGCSRNSSNFI